MRPYLRSTGSVLAAVALLAAGLAAVVLCRYTVRDIGFVDLHGPTYTIEVAPHRPDRVTADELKELQQAARHSNVRVTSAAVDGVAVTGKRAYALKADHRDGILLLDVAEANQGADVIRSAMLSPVQKILIEQALTTFAFLVVVESTESSVNQKVGALTTDAQDQLQKLAPQLPRPIEHPVQVLRIPPSKRETEKVLLWAMKLDDLPAKEAAIAVFYGRAKVVGPALRADSLTQRALLSQLALIGQSCECDTDRDWAAEPSLPHAWTPQQQKAALTSLGFQPDSPMVKSEVTRILNQVGKQKRIGLDESGAENDNPLIGYGEFRVENKGAAANPSRADDSLTVPSGDNAMLKTSSAGEGDWGFDDDSSSALSVGEAEQPAGPATREGPEALKEMSPQQLSSKISLVMAAIALLVVGVAAFLFVGGSRT